MRLVEHDPSRWGNVGHAKEATLGECLPGGIVDDDILTEAGQEGRLFIFTGDESLGMIWWKSFQAFSPRNCSTYTPQN